MHEQMEFVGVIPMAGRASRLPGIPCSKELLPFGIILDPHTRQKRMRVISEILVQRMVEAGVKKIHMILRNSKWDIPAYYRSGNQFGFDACYHIVENESAVPFTLDQPFTYTSGENILLGFPDIYFEPEDAFVQLKTHLITNPGTHLVLGVMWTEEPQNWDTAQINDEHLVVGIKIKETLNEDHGLAWFIAAWRPVFTEYLHEWLKRKSNTEFGQTDEIQFSRVILDFIADGHVVKAELIRKGVCIDTGTPEGLNNALLNYSGIGWSQ